MNQIQGYIEQQAQQWLGAAGLTTNSIAQLSEFSQFVSKFFIGGGWIFRGETTLHENPGSPSILRGNPPLTRNRYPGNSITDQEVEEVEKCQADHPDGSDKYLKAFIPSIHKHDVNWLPLARHFGYKTRLLDVTLNPLVALYFACTDSDETGDPFVYALAIGSCRPVNDRNPEQKNSSDYPPVPISYLDLYDVDIKFRLSNLDDLPYLFEPTIPQERMQAQAGRFLFWRNLDYVLAKERQLIPIRIDENSKKDILSQLSAFGINRRVLFPNEKA